MDQLTVDISTEESYDAPIAKGEKLGTVTYSFDGMKCATADLVSLTEVKRSPVLYALDLVEQFFHLTPVRIVLGIVCAAFVLYLILSFIAGRNRRRCFWRRHEGYSGLRSSHRLLCNGQRREGCCLRK